MIETEGSRCPSIDIKDLSFDQGAHLLVKKGLADLRPGERLEVRGNAPDVAVHLRAWCREQGHEIVWPNQQLNDNQHPVASPLVATLIRGSAITERWRGAQRAGLPDPRVDGAVVDRPLPVWGLAARGATVEAGGPEFHFGLSSKEVVWTDNVPRLYAQAAAAQWDPATAIDWHAPLDHPREVEDAVVQVMTYLIENETAALLVPAKFLAQVHPHFREVMQLLAIQVADEARHVEVFTRRATLRTSELGLSAASGQASLKTLVVEPDFTQATFLLSVLGEGTFLNLLWFLEEHAPDTVTRQVCHLAAQDEARHVAFGMAHIQYQLAHDSAALHRLAAAVERRHDALSQTVGLNEEVLDALVLIAAGAWESEAIARGFNKVQTLKTEMDEGRQSRLVRLGFTLDQAKILSSLHTKNFM